MSGGRLLYAIAVVIPTPALVAPKLEPQPDLMGL